MKGLFCSILGFALGVMPLFCQNSSDLLRFDDPVHDFGQVLSGKGPISCSFEGVNVSKSDVCIMSVTTSCGCTDVKWSHDPVKPGARVSIQATYSNDEGPVTFDKTLTVKIVGQTKPVILHMRGISQKEIKPDSEVYTNVFGGVIGLVDTEFKCSNLEMGESRGEQFTIANLSDKPTSLSFANVSAGLKMDVKPNPVPAHAHATVIYTISSQSGVYGYNYYCATPVVNGKDSGREIKVRAFTSEHFSNLTREQKNAGSRPVFDESTFSFGHKKKGARLTATFECVNKGQAPLKVYKVDTDYSGAVPGAFPEIAAGGKGSFSVSLDTSSFEKGEALVMITLTTNSPLRPIVTLFLAGIID